MCTVMLIHNIELVNFFFLEFFCMGGWEEEVPYSSLLSAQQDEYPSYKSKQNYFQRRNYNSYVVSDEEPSPFGDMVRQK